MQPIIRTKDYRERNLFVRRVFGLDILWQSQAVIPLLDDPRLLLLQTLCNQQTCSAHVGLLPMKGTSPTEYFGLSPHNPLGRLTHIGLDDATFSESEAEPLGYFFDRLPVEFLRSNIEKFEHLMLFDALALYLGPGENSLEQMHTLLASPFPGDDEWVQTVTSLYKIVLLTGFGGWYVEAYSQDPSHFALLSEPIDTVRAAIEGSDWYQHYAGTVQWTRRSKLPPGEQAEIEQTLRPILGEPFSDIWRVVGIQIFEFGVQHPFKNHKGEDTTRADWKLDASCTWRILGPEGEILSSEDFGPGKRWRDEKAYPFYEMLGDDGPIVEAIEVDEEGRIRFRMSRGYSLEIEPEEINEEPDEEQWRLVPKDASKPHFVVTAQGIRR